MKKIIEAFEIFLKYIDDEDDVISYINGMLCVDCDPDLLSEIDIDKLNELGFFIYEDFGGFASHCYGSC